jgi:hypothetical protein
LTPRTLPTGADGTGGPPLKFLRDLGQPLTTSSQVYLEQRREQRAEKRALQAAKREVGAELFDIAIAARTVWSSDEVDENYRHLFGRADQWERRAALLADDDSYVPVRLAYLFSEQTGRALDRGDRGSAVHYALETYDQVRAALKHLGQEGSMPELPSRFPDEAGDETGQA